MKKILITGVSSFIGFHLAKYFSHDFNVLGTLTKSIIDYKNIQMLRVNELIDYIEFVEEYDLRNHNMINKTIQYIKPDYFIHHAGWTNDYGSFGYDLVKGFEINVKPLSSEGGFCLSKNYLCTNRKVHPMFNDMIKNGGL